MSNSGFIQPIGCDYGVYLHWNGGYDSVRAFLRYCELKGYRELDKDSGYGLARLTQVIGNFFGGSCSLGIYNRNEISVDNGIYIVKGWEIIDRRNYSGFEQKEHDLNEMLIAIDESQPIKEQLGDFLKSEEIETTDVKIGDIVFMQELDGTYSKHTVVGFGKVGSVVNGHKVYNVPFVNRYKGIIDENVFEKNIYGGNINNYILSKTVRVFKSDTNKQ